MFPLLSTRLYVYIEMMYAQPLNPRFYELDKPTHLSLVWVWVVPSPASPHVPSSVAPAPHASLGRGSSSAHRSEHPAHRGRCTCPLGSVAAWPCMWWSFMYPQITATVPENEDDDGNDAWFSNPLLLRAFTTYKLSSPLSSHKQDTLSGEMTEYNIWKWFASYLMVYLLTSLPVRFLSVAFYEKYILLTLAVSF